MFLALVVNPGAGPSTDAEYLADLLRRGRARVEPVTLDALTPTGDLPACAAGAQRLVVAGGDGTVGPAAHAAHRAGIPLAVVPAGTANDFARALGLPLDPEAACALAADPGAHTRRQELGRVGDRLFVNTVAAGLSTAASRHAAWYKPRLGGLAYVLGAVRAGVSARTLDCRVSCDGRECFTGPAWQVVVAATGAFGAGSAIGGTWPDDQRLDVAVVPGGRRVALVRRAYGMRRASLTAQDDVGHHRGRVIDVHLPPGTEVNIDGELAPLRHARFELVPGGFQVVVP